MKFYSILLVFLELAVENATGKSVTHIGKKIKSNTGSKIHSAVGAKSKEIERIDHVGKNMLKETHSDYPFVVASNGIYSLHNKKVKLAHERLHDYYDDDEKDDKPTKQSVKPKKKYAKEGSSQSATEFSGNTEESEDGSAKNSMDHASETNSSYRPEKAQRKKSDGRRKKNQSTIYVEFNDDNIESSKSNAGADGASGSGSSSNLMDDGSDELVPNGKPDKGDHFVGDEEKTKNSAGKLKSLTENIVHSLTKGGESSASNEETEEWIVHNVKVNKDLGTIIKEHDLNSNLNQPQYSTATLTQNTDPNYMTKFYQQPSVSNSNNAFSTRDFQETPLQQQHLIMKPHPASNFLESGVENRLKNVLSDPKKLDTLLTRARFDAYNAAHQTNTNDQTTQTVNVREPTYIDGEKVKVSAPQSTGIQSSQDIATSYIQQPSSEEKGASFQNSNDKLSSNTTMENIQYAAYPGTAASYPYSDNTASRTTESNAVTSNQNIGLASAREVNTSTKQNYEKISAIKDSNSTLQNSRYIPNFVPESKQNEGTHIKEIAISTHPETQSASNQNALSINSERNEGYNLFPQAFNNLASSLGMPFASVAQNTSTMLNNNFVMPSSNNEKSSNPQEEAACISTCPATCLPLCDPICCRSGVPTPYTASNDNSQTNTQYLEPTDAQKEQLASLIKMVTEQKGQSSMQGTPEIKKAKEEIHKIIFSQPYAPDDR